jgi:histidyl-tRNA synthetase
VGEDEMASGKAVLRNMTAKTQEEVSLEDLVQNLKKAIV